MEAEAVRGITTVTPNLVIQSFGRVWQALEERQVSVTLVGGLALPVWNYPRSTQDIDLMLLMTNEQQLLELCKTLGCRPRRSPAIVDLGNIRALQTELTIADQYVEIDIDFLIGQSEFHVNVANRAITIDYAGIQSRVRVATCEDLILLKLQSARLIDMADCQRLIELNSGMDWNYLNDWACKLQLSEQLERASAS